MAQLSEAAGRAAEGCQFCGQLKSREGIQGMGRVAVPHPICDAIQKRNAAVDATTSDLYEEVQNLRRRIVGLAAKHDQALSIVIKLREIAGWRIVENQRRRVSNVFHAIAVGLDPDKPDD